MKFSLRSLRAGHNSRERLQAIATNNVKRDKRCCGNRLIKKVRLPWAEPFACPAEAFHGPTERSAAKRRFSLLARFRKYREASRRSAWQAADLVLRCHTSHVLIIRKLPSSVELFEAGRMQSGRGPPLGCSDAAKAPRRLGAAWFRNPCQFAAYQSAHGAGKGTSWLPDLHLGANCRRGIRKRNSMKQSSEKKLRFLARQLWR